MKNKKRGAFTLVEIVLVVAILAVVSGATVYWMSGNGRNHREIEINAKAEAVVKALNTYNSMVAPGERMINSVTKPLKADFLRKDMTVGDINLCIDIDNEMFGKVNDRIVYSGTDWRIR